MEDEYSIGESDEYKDEIEQDDERPWGERINQNENSRLDFVGPDQTPESAPCGGQAYC